jgi:hypothetical protein
MSAIEFQAEISSDGVIPVPEGVSLPLGKVNVRVASWDEITESRASDHSNTAAHEEFPKPANYASTGEWLAAVGRYAETLDTDLPADLAENHDYYAHGKPRQ